MKCVTAWLNNNDRRCQTAQRRMLHSLLMHDLHPVIVNGTPRPLLSDMLLLARRLTDHGGTFMWLNSDCWIGMLPPYDHNVITGLHRRESADGSICGGVDGYIIPCHLWDTLYAPDLPGMYVGGTHVDWWLSRCAEKHGVYRRAAVLHHLTHERTAASAGLDDYGQHNLRVFHEWAARNEIPTGYEN